MGVMSAAPDVGPGVCHILLEDPDLAEAVPAGQREQVANACTVREVLVPAGPWEEHESLARDGFGMLVIDGLLIRRAGIEGRFGAELIGRGDLIRPWQDESGFLTLPLSTIWMASEPSRLALLDQRFAVLLGRYPALAARVLSRAVRRARNLAVNMAIVHHARVDVRLSMLFWHLASRFGRVRGDGVFVPLRLTHALLAELVAARRPTVTSALSALAREGSVLSLDDGWLLSGDPPGELPYSPHGGVAAPPDNGPPAGV
jgi:CRP/FNR family transcriptional regulator, cyclic AMP receptor protein